jgi:Flp pilus assembly pilin Flp
MRNLIHRTDWLIADETAATIVEYALLFVAFASILIVALNNVSAAMRAQFTDLAGSI